MQATDVKKMTQKNGSIRSVRISKHSSNNDNDNKNDNNFLKVVHACHHCCYWKK